jgi:alcohol dehydrogenase YqhD (iron-dependent ADH family)
MNWVWSNTTQVAFGKNAVQKYLPQYVKPNSNIICTFGGGSMEKNGYRKDIETVLSQLNLRFNGKEDFKRIKMFQGANISLKLR